MYIYGSLGIGVVVVGVGLVPTLGGQPQGLPLQLAENHGNSQRAIFTKGCPLLKYVTI